MLEIINKLPISFYVAFSCSIAGCLLIIKAKDRGWMNQKEREDRVQKIHEQRTPRVGGVAVFAAVVCAYFVENSSRATILGPLILAGFSAFLFGLAEDITYKVGIITRLIATILAGVVGWAITGISLTNSGLEIINELLKNLVFSVVFTAFAVGGIANAINFIDGLNGLAGFMLMVGLITVSAISYNMGDIHLAIASLTIAASIFGFFLVNWPRGLIFLGDCGSYFCGFALAWSCVLMVERNPSISPFAGLLVCIYPFTEVIFSLYRRKIRSYNITQPDIQHLHSLVYRRYIRSTNRRINENSIAGIVVGLFSIPPSIFAYYFKDNNIICIVGTLIFMFCYIIIYLRLIRFRWF